MKHSRAHVQSVSWVIDLDAIEEKKMIGKMIEGLPEENKFDLNNENIVEFKDDLEEAVITFYYGSVARETPLKHDENGNFSSAANINEPNSFSLCKVMDFAQQTLVNDNGYRIVDSEGAAETEEVALSQRNRSSALGT